jgi:hypothetical protein
LYLEPELDILFVHVPKTGGTAVKGALIETYGPENVYSDYTDEPGHPLKKISIDPDGYLRQRQAKLANELAGRRVVVGHLWFKKYERAHLRFVATVLRNPIERAISHYFFWLSTCWPSHPVHAYVLAQSLSFRQFARLPMIRHLYTGLFFRGVDMSAFDLIVPYETLRMRWPFISRQLGVEAPLADANRTEALLPDYWQRAGDILADNKGLAELREIFRSDLNFYEKHCR